MLELFPFFKALHKLVNDLDAQIISKEGHEVLADTKKLNIVRSEINKRKIGTLIVTFPIVEKQN